MPKSKDSSVQVAVIVAGLLAVIGGAWLFLNSGNDAVIENTQMATTGPSSNNSTDSNGRNNELLPVDTALQMAELAFQSGQLTGSEEGTAFSFYRQVLEQEPENNRAKAGMQLIAIQLVDEAEEMMGKGDYEQVVMRVKELNKIEAGSDAVLSLQGRLIEKSAGMFTEMDQAISRGELDRAEALARSLRVIPDADPGRINAAMVTIANTRKDREKAIADAQAAAQRQAEIQNLPVTESVTVVSNSGFSDQTDERRAPDSVASVNTSVDIQTGVAANGVVETASTDTFDVVDPAEQVRDQILALLAEASTKVEADRLISPDGDNALDVYNQILALDSTNAEAKRGLRGLVQKMTSTAYDLADAGNIDQARAVLDDAETVGIATPLVTQAREDVRETWLQAESQKVFALGGFRVQKSVPPKYPKRAMTRSIEGWVRVEFTIAEDGNTRDIEVIESSKRLSKQFSSAALAAVRQWQFEPRVLDGQVIAQRSETTVQFKLAE